ncbi:MAG: DUF2889 domain-containing protein [Pseudomonadales bacterium]|nr:DUF2889 domain-containing protein [Pseudomonadales bacterium]
MSNPDNNPNDVAPINPAYGTGMFRRRIRLTSGEDWVFGELEDSSHAFKVRLSFEGDRIIDVASETIRYPMTTCSTAGHPLRAIIGMPLGLSAGELAKQLTPRLQCTHLFDLSVLAYQHIHRTDSVRVYDIQIPDETEAKRPRPLEVYQDGQRVLSWMVRDWQIFDPSALNGHTLRSGFSKWLEALYPEDEQQKEWAWLAQKGYLVSQARIFDINQLGGTRRFVGDHMVGICHTYSEAQIKEAEHTHLSFIDFTDNASELLAFKPLES